MGVQSQCCSGGVPISGNLALPAGQGQQVQLLLTYDQNTLRDLFAGNENLQDRSRLRGTSSLLFETSYGLTNRLSISALFSFVRQNREIETIPGRFDQTQTAGLGDMVLLARYQLLTTPTTGLLLGLGPKIPTGRFNLRDEQGFWISADLQPGSGAWDAISWLSFSTQLTQGKNPLSLNLNATYRLTGTADRLDGLQRYRFGDEFQAYAGVGGRFLWGKWLIDPLGMFRLRAVRPDQINGFDLANTGGLFVHAVPGIVWNFSPSTAVRVSSEWPLYRQVSGTQLATSQKITVALFFSLGKNQLAPFGAP